MVYYDEPSTGLDPASRRALWATIRKAKPGRGMILTTHSMEEAAVLCDRIGVFVGGALVMVGPPKQLVQRYGGWYALSLTTPAVQAEHLAHLVAAALPSARRTYVLQGCQRFEVPIKGITLSKVRAWAAHIPHTMNNIRAVQSSVDEGLSSYQSFTKTQLFALVGVWRLEVEMLDWGISNATLEDVFVRFCNGTFHNL